MKVALLILTALSAYSTTNSTGLRGASNCFGLRLLPVLPRPKAAPNVFYSPYSLSAAMGMIYAGSRGRTQEELYSVLGYKSAHIAKDRVLEEHGIYAQNLNAFDAHIMNVDFHKDGSSVVRDINRWISRETRGYIKHLFRSPFPRSTKLVLLNIIYFKGIWKTRFDKSETTKLPFFNDGKTKVPVDMMCGRMNASHGYSDELSSEILDLPFEGGDYSMTIILPLHRRGVKNLRHLSPRSLRAALHSLSTRIVKVYLPRFNFTTKYFLREEFAKLGLTRVFDAHKADLSGMTGHGCDRLHVDEVVHKAVIHVDESGATAAAVTGTTVQKSHSIPHVFRARHPFLFLIRKSNDNSILFVGEVNRL
ncbi:hypothetical protein HPB52_023954 [Rhipicephalus sanguineus]|uniref:Serpin domain-containing protein n=1 Tax=Rhipicephalus sanguineus TaxID=34632 RepID=A0A9D4T3E8_RHISA|nr:hypothetical protein HPB52_023954 [Rhipicephalus sanguineus]